jgi:50S ribosomal subunit-associated GTPase HflX
VPAFAATLEAVQQADVLIHVIDVAKPTWEDDHRMVLEILEQEVLHEQEERPQTLNVLNKIDLCPNGVPDGIEGVAISALEGLHLDRLRERIASTVFPEDREVAFTFPLRVLHKLSPLTTSGRAQIVQYTAEAACVEANVSTAEWALLEREGACLIVSDVSRAEGP